MLEELRWKTSLSATCLHAATCRALGLAAADPQLAAAIDPAADVLASEIATAGWPVPALLQQLTGLAAEIDNNRELVARATARLNLPAADAAAPVRIAGAIADLEAALQQAQPELAEELPLRIGPLREQWEARGPGMLREVARLADAGMVPSAAEIVLAAPYAGGHGLAHAAHNRVTLEAVLVNPLPELPEAVRIAWLLCQLNSDLPRFADVLPPGRAAQAFRLAAIPPVLAAAAEVELGPGDEAGLAAALSGWGLDAELPADASSQLWAWWNAWLDGAANWPVAVAALDQMLA